MTGGDRVDGLWGEMGLFGGTECHDEMEDDFQLNDPRHKTKARERDSYSYRQVLWRESRCSSKMELSCDKNASGKHRPKR